MPAHYYTSRFLLAAGDGEIGSGVDSSTAEGDEGNEYWFPALAYKVYYPIIAGLILVAVILLLCACMGWTHCCTVCCRKSRKGKMDVRQLEEQGGIIGGEHRLNGETAMVQNGALQRPSLSGGEGVRLDLELTELSGEEIERRESGLMQERAASVEGLGDGETTGQMEQQTTRDQLTPNPVGPGERDALDGTDTEQAGAVHREPKAEAGKKEMKSEQGVCTAEVHDVEELDKAAANFQGPSKRVKASLPPPLDIHPAADNEQGEYEHHPSSAENQPTSGASYASNSLPNALAATGKLAVSAPASATMGRVQHTNPPYEDTQPNDTQPQPNTQHGYLAAVDILPPPKPRRRHSAEQQPSLYGGSARQKKGAVDRPTSLDQESIQKTDEDTRRYSADQASIIPHARLSRDSTAGNLNSGKQETAPNSTSSLVQSGRLFTETRGRSKTLEKTEQTDV
jgi:hypothetical protein